MFTHYMMFDPMYNDNRVFFYTCVEDAMVIQHACESFEAKAEEMDLDAQATHDYIAYNIKFVEEWIKGNSMILNRDGLVAIHRVTRIN